jgi:hypothetical protein
MAKVKHRNVKFSPEEMAYDLPDELDLKKSNPDPRKTLLRAFAVLGMLVIAVTGLGYSIWVIWTEKH